jgi:hypothetical protein
MDSMVDLFEEKVNAVNVSKIACWAGQKKFEKTEAECNKFEEELSKLESECDADQQELEIFVCEAIRNSVCETLATCHSGAVATYEEAEAAVKKEEPGIQDEWKAAKRIDCILGALTKRNADLKEEINNCAAMTNSVEDLKMFYYHSPPQPECEAGLSLHKPCTGGFKATYFSGVPLHKQCVSPCSADPAGQPDEVKDCGSRLELHYHYFPDPQHPEKMTRPDWQFLNSVWQCQDKCREADGCTRFTYEPNHQCHIDNGASQKRIKTYTEQHGVLAGQPQCADGERGALPKLPSYNVSCMSAYAMYTPLGWEGFEPSIFSTVMDCQQQCEVTDKCVAFTFMPKGSCYLHDSAAVRVSTTEGFIAGDKTCEKPCLQKGGYKKPNGNLGREYKDVANSLICHKKCTATKECAAFTFFSDKRCFLAREGSTFAPDIDAVAGERTCV